MKKRRNTNQPQTGGVGHLESLQNARRLRAVAAKRGTARVSRLVCFATLVVVLAITCQLTIAEPRVHESVGGEALGVAPERSRGFAGTLPINPFRRQCAFEKTAVYDSALIRSLRIGDLIFVRAVEGEFLQSLITEFTSSPYTHVAVYVGDGWCISSEAYGISYEGELLHKFVDVMKVRGGLTKAQQSAIVAAAQSTLGRCYGYGTLFRFPFLSEHAAEIGGTAYVCSEHAALTLAAGGIDVTPASMPSPIPAPADIAHAENLVWIGSWNNGEPVPDARLNERHPLQGEPSKLARLMVRVIADPFSKNDEYYRSLADSEPPLRVATSK